MLHPDSSNGFAQDGFPRLPVLGPALLPDGHGSMLCVLSQRSPTGNLNVCSDILAEEKCVLFPFVR
jgi:hypothetical protein